MEEWGRQMATVRYPENEAWPKPTWYLVLWQVALGLIEAEGEMHLLET